MRRAALRTVALRGMRRRLTSDETGFTLIETVLAMMLFAIVATALTGLLTSAVNAQGLAREKTLAEQAANDQIEAIRQLPYNSVGTVGGNPPGTVVASIPVSKVGLSATIVTKITYVNDPTPTSYQTAANYKKIVVTVVRTRDSKVLTSQATYRAPPGQAPYGGINDAIINLQVLDMGSSNTPVANVTVGLGASGSAPSAPRSDTTDPAGNITFAALTANPTSSDYYVLTVTPPSGYVALSDDVSPSAAARVSLAPGQTFNTVLRIYQPATMYINVTSGGAPYSGTATVTVTSSRGTNTYPVTGGSTTITGVVPGIQYTVSATTSTGLIADPVAKTVPNAYPTDLTSTFDLPLYRPNGTLAVNAQQNGTAAAGATVTLSGGPNSISLTGTTDGAGNVSFASVPAGPGYTVTATKGGQTGTQSATVVGKTTTNVTVTIPPTAGTVAANVTWAGVNVAGASVTLSGGPNSINVSGTSDSAGNVTFTNVPGGTGYTVTATKSGQSATATGQTVTAGATTSVNLALPTGTVAANVTWAGVNVSGASVTLSGGPMAVSVTGSSDSSGNVTFANVPAGTGYTVTATKSGQSASATGQTVTGGATTNVSLALPTATLVVTVKRSTTNQVGAIVRLSGGPMSIAPPQLTTNGSGQATFTNVPVGSGYTIKAYANPCSSVSNPKSKTLTSVNVVSGTTNVTATYSTSTCPLP